MSSIILSEVREDSRKAYEEVFRKTLETDFPQDREVWRKALRACLNRAGHCKQWFRSEIGSKEDSDAYRNALVWTGVARIVSEKYGKRFVSK